MNLRNWSKEHTKGFIVGILTIIGSIFIVIGIFTFQNNASYSLNFNRFLFLHDFTAKVISLAAIGNLPWFHFVSLKQGKWAFGQGLIMATVLDLLIMLTFKFIL
jgi:hypothetical protein